jgi:hypothetical protein
MRTWEATTKLITKRLRRLENPVASGEVQGPSAADILRARRRRRLEAAGLPYEEPRVDPAFYANGRRPTWAEVLRSARARRCANAATAPGSES